MWRYVHVASISQYGGLQQTELGKFFLYVHGVNLGWPSAWFSSDDNITLITLPAISATPPAPMDHFSVCVTMIEERFPATTLSLAPALDGDGPRDCPACSYVSQTKLVSESASTALLLAIAPESGVE